MLKIISITDLIYIAEKRIGCFEREEVESDGIGLLPDGEEREITRASPDTR